MNEIKKINPITKITNISNNNTQKRNQELIKQKNHVINNNPDFSDTLNNCKKDIIQN
jgi:hypothetical protein